MTLFTEIFSGTCKIAPKIVMIELNEIQRKERIKKTLTWWCLSSTAIGKNCLISSVYYIKTIPVDKNSNRKLKNRFFRQYLLVNQCSN